MEAIPPAVIMAQEAGRDDWPPPRASRTSGALEAAGRGGGTANLHVWLTCVYARVTLCTLTYGPQDSVEGARVLLARGEVLPGDLELAVWKLLHS